MDLNRQKQTPLLKALKDYVESNPTPFDVPGHKMGRIHTELADLIGIDAFKYDVNAPIGIDIFYHGSGVIEESSSLLADAYNADKALFLINGTTSGIMIMIMGTVSMNEKIILPRNVHKSVINSLIISGAYPVFVEPQYDQRLGIANNITVEEYIKAMDENKDAKAIFIIHPTYFGVTCDIKRVVNEAHKRNMIVLVDEAHGAHFAFHEELPISAMEANADISAVSIHKTLGSLTQSSALLIKGNRVSYEKILKVYSMLGSTSPSHLLLASIDAARKYMVFHGKEVLENNIKIAEYAKKELNNIPGISCLTADYIKKEGNEEFDLDPTRLVISVRDLGKSGFEIMHLLRKKYNIQLELAETYLVLAILAVGSKKEDVDKLINAFKEISSLYYEKGKKAPLKNFIFDYADIYVSPRIAYNAPSMRININEAKGKISSEAVMIYPPGIPLLIPGEIISENILEIYEFYKKSGGTIIKDSPLEVIQVIDESKWKKGDSENE